MISWCRILRRSHARIERIRIIFARSIILNDIFTEAVHAHVRHTRTERSCINLFHLFVAHWTKKSKKHNRITCVVVYKNKKVETRILGPGFLPLQRISSIITRCRQERRDTSIREYNSDSSYAHASYVQASYAVQASYPHLSSGLTRHCSARVRGLEEAGGRRLGGAAGHRDL